MKINFKVFLLLSILGTATHTQTSENPSEKTLQTYLPGIVSLASDTIYYTPSNYMAFADFAEPIALHTAGYSRNEVYNKMISERMFALSIAAIVYPPAMLPIAYSLYRRTNPLPKTWTGLTTRTVAQEIIKAGINKII